MKIQAIVGPTGAGKTAVALRLAKQYQLVYPAAEIHLVSVDSRQVYRGVETVSGADIPAGFSSGTERFRYPFFQKENQYLHGVASISPLEEWSVAHFQQFVWHLITDLEQYSKPETLVVLVGGTGLYHDCLMQFDSRLHIQPDSQLRAQWEQASLAALQAEVCRLSEQTYRQLSKSDQQNPRRLIRHVEILSSPNQVEALPLTPPQTLDVLAQTTGIPTIGITADRATLRDHIQARVLARLQLGAIAEVEQLLQLEKVSSQLLSATGVAEIRDYQLGILSYEGMVEKWVTREYQYAKRQLTWWRARPSLQWFSAADNQALAALTAIIAA